jgi:hypothetical protein
VIAVDTNILVHAHRAESRWHEPAASALRRLAEGRAAWGLPWPCLHEFLGIVTHPRIYDPPTPIAAALDQVDAWLESPTVTLLTETADYWSVLRDLVHRSQVSGPRVHDARIAAICAAHGVRELWSSDRDVSRFPNLATSNPLVAPPA